MSELRCQYSGAPIHVARPQPGRKYFSCTGCALASRVPVDAQGNFPINRTLITVLLGGLVIFNQGLFWLLAWLLAGQGRQIVSDRFVVASLGVGGAMWLLLVITQWRATGGGRWTDWLVVQLTAVLLAFGLIVRSPGCVLAAVVILVVWGARGLRRKR